MQQKTKSFRRQMYLFFVVSVTVPTLIVASLLSLFFNRRVEADSRVNIANTLTVMSGGIEAQFTELERIGFSPYLYKDILSFMAYMRNGFMLEPPPYTSTPAGENNYVLTMSKMMFTARQNIQSIVFYPDAPFEGTYYRYAIHRNTAGLQVLENEDYSSLAWYLAAQEQAAIYQMQPAYTDAQGKEKHDYAYIQAIWDPDSKKLLGVLRIEVSADLLKELVAAIDLQGASQLLLVDGEGGVLLREGGGDDGLASIAEINESRYTLLQTSLGNTGWHLYYCMDKQPMLQTQRLTFLIAMLICAAITLVALLIYRRESERTVQSVNNILATLRSIRKGDFSARASVPSRTELSAIAQGVNKMGQQVETHIEREYKAVIGRQNAEYRALQAQINPHFLYNTLNDFVALNRMGETQVLEDSIIRLTALFRYTCSPADVTTVAEEMDFCEKYLGLRSLQLEDRLLFVFDIDPATEGMPLPKLILQPLVENSLLHGYGNMGSQLTVLVSATLDMPTGTLHLCVEDDGIGFTEDDITKDRPHLGIANVRERIAIFSAGSTLCTQSTPGKGTRVDIAILPQQREE